MMPRWETRIGAALLLLGLLFAAQPAPEQTGLGPLRQAEAHFVAGAFTAAESAFLEAETQLPASDTPERRLAALYARWNRPNEGLNVLQTVPDTEPLLELQLLKAAGDWKALAAATLRYLEHTPAQSEAHALRVQALLQQHLCREALDAAEIWMRQAPGSEAESAWLHLRLVADPVETLPEACPRDPELCALMGAPGCVARGDCARRLGESLLRRREPALAACALERAVEAQPTNAEAHAWLGAALEQLGQPTAALPHFERATQLAPDAPLGWLRVGMARFIQQHFEPAREALLRAQQLDPANPAPCLAMAAVLAAQGRYTDIPIWTTAALERAPEDAEIWKGVARFYLTRNLRLEEEPRRAAEGAVRLAPHDAEAWTLLGWVYFNAREYEAALDALQHALSHDAQRAETYHFLGLTLRALARHTEAEAAFIRAADLGYQR